MRKKYISLHILFLLSFSLTIFGQNIQFPKVEPFSSGPIKIFSEWTPSQKFLKLNPNFLKDGSYQLSEDLLTKNDKYFNSDAKGGYNCFPEIFRNIGSDEFPATYEMRVHSRNNSDVLKGVHFTFTCNQELKNNLPYDRRNTFAQEAEIDIDDIGKNLSELNSIFNIASGKIASENNIKKYEVVDFARSEYGNTFLEPSDVILDFQCIGIISTNKGKMWIPFLLPVPGVSILLPPNMYYVFFAKHKQGSYPSTCLYQLNVKDVTGKIIKSYKQAIFIGEKHRIENSFSRETDEYPLLKSSMKVGMQSLLNRFLNDEAAVQNTQLITQQWDELKNENPTMVEMIRAKARLNHFESMKEMYLARLKETNQQLREQGQTIKEDLSGPQQPLQAMVSQYYAKQLTNNTLNTLGSSIANLGKGYISKYAIDKLMKTSKVLTAKYKETEKKEAAYLSSVKSIIENDPSISLYLNSNQGGEELLTSVLKEVSESQKFASGFVDKYYNNAKNSFDEFSSSLNSSNNSQTNSIGSYGSGNSAIANTNAMSGVSKGANATKVNPKCTPAQEAECKRNIDLCYKQSAEYLKWQRTRSNIDYLEQDAKLYQCALDLGSKCMSDAGIIAIKKALTSAKQAAAGLRSAR